MKFNISNKWNCKKLKNIDIEIIDGDRGKNYPKLNDFLEEGYCLFLNTGNIKNNKFNFSECNFISQERDNLLRSGKLVRGDIVLTTRGTVGSVAYYNETIPYENVRINSGMVIIRNEFHEMLTRYLYFLLTSNLIQRQIRLIISGSAQPQLPIKDLRHLRIIFPTFLEQQEITLILSNIDDLITHTEKIIDNLNILKKGLMQRLFTEGIGHTEFKETRLGRIPKEWEIVPILKIGKVVGGGTPDTKTEIYWNGNIPWATPTDITSLHGKYISHTNRCLSNDGLNSSSAKLIPPYSLLMTSRASIGYCAINTIDMCTNQGFQNVIPNNNIDVEFLYYLIQNKKIQDELTRYAYGSTFLEIPNKDVKKVKIPLPKLNEQKEIVSILSNLDNMIINNDEKIKSMKIIKTGLMQDLLTGKKRVKIN